MQRFVAGYAANQQPQVRTTRMFRTAVRMRPPVGSRLVGLVVTSVTDRTTPTVAGSPSCVLPFYFRQTTRLKRSEPVPTGGHRS